MAMKGYSAFPKATLKLETSWSYCLAPYPGNLFGGEGLTYLQRCFFRCSWNFALSLASNWINFSRNVVFIGCILPLCNRGVAVFSQVGTENFPCFQEGYIPLVFHLKYFLFFFVNIARSYVSRMILSAICTSDFFQANFLHVTWVLFNAFGTCLSSSTSFHVVSWFLAFEALQGSRDLLLNSLKIIIDFLLGSTRLIKCQDVSVGLDSLMAFSDWESFYICNSQFFQGWCYLLFCSQANSLLLITPLEVLSG